MAFWRVTAHRDFPIWTVARRLIQRDPLDEERVQWLLESSDIILAYPRSRRGIQSVEAVETDVVEAESADDSQRIPR